MAPHLLKHILASSTCAGMNCFVPGFVVIIYLSLARPFCSQKYLYCHDLYWSVDLCLPKYIVPKFRKYSCTVSCFLWSSSSTSKPQTFLAWAHPIHFHQSLYQLEELWAFLVHCTFHFLQAQTQQVTAQQELEQTFGQTISQKTQTCIWDKQLDDACEKQLQGHNRAFRFRILAYYIFWKIAGSLWEASWTRRSTILNSCFILMITLLSSHTFWCSQAKRR